MSLFTSDQSGVILRPRLKLCFARHSDCDDLAEIDRRSFPKDSWPRLQFARMIARDEGRVCAVLRRGDLDQAVGFCVFRRETMDVLEIDRFAVHPDWRRRKAGGMLARACIRKAAEHGVKTVRLVVRESNISGCVFWSKMGFRAVGVRWKHYRDEDGYLFERTLEPAECAGK